MYIFEKVKEITVEQLGVEEDAVTMEASFISDLEADSLDIVELMMALEEEFDIEIPEINAVYTHMLGHDCHSIVAGAGHADGIIAELRSYIEKGYGLILTSHYTPEDLKDAQTKIDYLENLKKIAANCADSDTFKAEVQKQYPAYSGQNYLDMTAGFFFA